MAAPRPKGNDRTSQSKLFMLYEITDRTRHIQDVHVRDQRQRDLATFEADGDRDVLDKEAQLGRPLHADVLEQRLHILNPNLIFEVSVHDKTKRGIYIVKTDVNPKTQRRETFKSHVCGYENGIMPEFSERIPVREEQYTKEGEATIRIKHAREGKRGWRTVLMKLIRAGLITEPAAVKAFGILEGKVSANWNKQLTGGQPLIIS